jgi:hypothetical protein
MRPLATIAILAAAGGLLAGCALTHRVTASINPASVGLGDRCAYITKLAMPYADIDIPKRTAENTGIRTMVARVEGTRDDLPEDDPAHDLAAECQFEDNVLTGFQWTKGGPAVTPAPAPAPASP